MQVPTDEGFNGVWGTGPDDVFVAGSTGTLLHYDGVSWLPIRWAPDDRETDRGVFSVWGTAEALFVGGYPDVHLYTRTAPVP
jgi:hypothetical protein